MGIRTVMFRSLLAVGGTATAIAVIASLLRRRDTRETLPGNPYRLLFEQNPLPMLVIDDASRELLHVNEAAVRTYGYAREELMAMTLDAIRPDVERHRRRRGITVHRRKDGSRMDVEVTGHRFALGGRTVQLLQAHDVTDRVRAERRLQESRETLRRFSARLQTAVESERARIAREIHDELGQALTGLRMSLAWMRGRLPGDEPLREATQEMDGLIDETLRTVRRLSTELRPGVLDAFGLIAALEWLTRDSAQRTRIPCTFQPPGADIEIEPPDRAVHVFRVVQEALTNAARHGAPATTTVRVQEDGDDVIVQVDDDGRGFDVEAATRHVSLGIVGMRERAHLLGGTFDLASSSDGTRVSLRFPRLARTEPA